MGEARHSSAPFRQFEDFSESGMSSARVVVRFAADAVLKVTNPHKARPAVGRVTMTPAAFGFGFFEPCFVFVNSSVSQIIRGTEKCLVIYYYLYRLIIVFNSSL